MKQKNLLLTVLTLVLMTTAINSAAALKFQGGAPRINNQPFLLDQEVVLNETITVRRENKDPAGSFFVTFSAGRSGDFSSRYMVQSTGAPMYYNLYADPTGNTILKDLSAGPSSTEVLAGSFSENDVAERIRTKDLTFTVIFDRDQFPLAGTYQDELTISLYLGSPGDPTPGGPVETNVMSISAVMDPVMELSLVDDGGNFDANRTRLLLDFGTLYEGKTREADLLIRSNSPYSVLISSLHSGIMPIQDTNDTSVVPYSLQLDGSPVNLSSDSAQPVSSLTGPSSVSGDRYNIAVTILDFGMATEGLYSDILTVTVAAQ